MTRHHTRRLTASMATVDAVVAMAGGNAAAILILVRLVGDNILALITLDDLGIYGDEIYYAFTDVYGADMDAFIAAILDNSILDRLKGIQSSELPR